MKKKKQNHWSAFCSKWNFSIIASVECCANAHFIECNVLLGSWMLIKKFDIYIFQKRWQTLRISRSYSGIILSFACSCMHSSVSFHFLFTCFFFVSYYYYWTSVLSWLVGFYSSINFSFWYLLLRYIHSERSFSLAWAIIKVNTYFTIVVLKRCVSIALPHIKSCHMQLWEIESDRASERTTEEERAGRVKTSLYQTTTVCNVMSDVN